MITQEAADLTLEAHTPKLLANSNVAYAAVIEKENGFVIEVGAYSTALNESSRVLSLSDVPSAPDPIPDRLKVPERAIKTMTDDESMRSIEVEVVESGPIVAQYTGAYRPSKGGDSIGNIRSNSAGTLGAAVTISTLPGRVFIITNWHVLVGGFGHVGDVVLQPGFLDGGRGPADWIANLYWSTLNARVDLALAELRQPHGNYVDLGKTRCHGQITGANYSPSANSFAKKCGRTTDGTTGTVRSTNASVNVSGYPGGTFAFTNQMLLTHMSKPGDSGSLVLDTDNQAIGLLFAGDGATVTFANRIDEVERALPSGKAGGLGAVISYA